MSKRTLAAVMAGLMLSTASFSAMATDLVIYHTWSAGPEVAALNVLKSALEAKGHSWTDIAIPHDTGSNVNLMSMVTGGSPPNLFVESNPGVFRDLAGLGYEFDLTQWYADNNILANLPKAVADSLSVDGKIVKVPMALHIDGMVYYNMDVAKKIGVDPASWTSIDAMFADFPKIREAGVAPLAVGSQPFQVGYLFHTLVAAEAGQDLYNRVYGEDVDETALDDPMFAKALQDLRLFANEAGPDSQNRPWNETTNEVITGKALMQIHGDWMKGEWLAAGKKAGTDFGCLPIPGAKALSASVDSWGLLGGSGVTDDVKTAELDFASIVVDPSIQAKFAAAKGSTPVRSDAPAASLDACSTEVLKDLSDPTKGVQTPNAITDADWRNSIWDVVFNYWSDPSMTVEDAIAKMHENYETILG